MRSLRLSACVRCGAPKDHCSGVMRCRWGAKFGCIVLLASLVVLAIANFIGAPLWAVTLTAAGVLVGGNM